MTLKSLETWKSTEAFGDYLKRHDGHGVETVIRRTRRYLRGEATEAERQKVESFIGRMKAVDAGPPVNGSGPSAVSDRTASLRNWGYDPTGRFVP